MCSAAFSEEEHNHGGLDVFHTDKYDNQDLSDHSLTNDLDTSDNESENQSACGTSDTNSEKQSDNVLPPANSERMSESNYYLDINDPKVIKLFEQPKPSEDPLWVNFFLFQRNKRKLLKLLENPLGIK